jgi:hypothetical protein
MRPGRPGHHHRPQAPAAGTLDQHDSVAHGCHGWSRQGLATVGIPPKVLAGCVPRGYLHGDLRLGSASPVELRCRDAQDGCDRQHGWDLEPVVRRPTTVQVEEVVSQWAFGMLLQRGVEDQPADAPALILEEATDGIGLSNADAP